MEGFLRTLMITLLFAGSCIAVLLAFLSSTEL